MWIFYISTCQCHCCSGKITCNTTLFGYVCELLISTYSMMLIVPVAHQQLIYNLFSFSINIYVLILVVTPTLSYALIPSYIWSDIDSLPVMSVYLLVLAIWSNNSHYDYCWNIVFNMQRLWSFNFISLNNSVSQLLYY